MIVTIYSYNNRKNENNNNYKHNNIKYLLVANSGKLSLLRKP